MDNYSSLVFGVLTVFLCVAPLRAQPPRPPRPSGPGCVVKSDEVPNGQGIPVSLNGNGMCKPFSERPDRIRLTDDVANQAGSAYATSTFRNTRYYPFETFFEYEIVTEQNETPADGLAFVIHDDPTGGNFLSSNGGGLGLYNGYPGSGPGGIRNALIVELDTYRNEGPYPPFSTNEYVRAIDIITTDSDGYATRLHEEDISLTIPWSDQGKLWISHSVRAPNSLDIYFGGKYTDPRPSNPLISLEVDLSAVLGQYPYSNDIFCGFSASTGGQYSAHEIVRFAGCEEKSNPCFCWELWELLDFTSENVDAERSCGRSSAPLPALTLATKDGNFGVVADPFGSSPVCNCGGAKYCGKNRLPNFCGTGAFLCGEPSFMTDAQSEVCVEQIRTRCAEIGLPIIPPED
mmetsp:Transcript_34711/g.75973  ORF Transcript_34711/g.75973 Transcript_34711/m.75973 type:complete len:403 (+) Transcript_34711:466-1674(+)